MEAPAEGIAEDIEVAEDTVVAEEATVGLHLANSRVVVLAAFVAVAVRVVAAGNHSGGMGRRQDRN